MNTTNRARGMTRLYVQEDEVMWSYRKLPSKGGSSIATKERESREYLLRRVSRELELTRETAESYWREVMRIR